MRVYLYVTPFFPSSDSWRGGYCLDFVKALMRRTGWNILVFVPGEGEDYEIEGVKVYRFPVRLLPSAIFPMLFARWNQRSFLRSVARAGVDVKDVVVCHGNTGHFQIYPLAIKKLNPKCKTLLHHHDLSSFGLTVGALRHCWLYNLIQFPILRRLHEKMDCHVFISEAARRSFLAAPDTSWTQFEDYKKQMRGLPYRSVKIKDSVILHNGVDKKIFSRVERVERVDFVIGCVGNLSELKDQLGLLKAVQILSTRSTSLHGKKLKVVFVGSGETLEECKRFAAENGLDVEFKSEVTHEQLADFYRSLDLFVLPSTFEGFGCVYTEAHSCGVPFIACEGQGIEDVLVGEMSGSGTKESPWLCKQRDPIDLARKIGDYISRVERGERVEQRLNEDQDIDKLVEKFVEEIGV